MYKYPIKCQSKHSNIIVLFTSLTRATVINNSECSGSCKPVGYYANNWYAHTNLDRWKVLHNTTIWLSKKQK